MVSRKLILTDIDLMVGMKIVKICKFHIDISYDISNMSTLLLYNIIYQIKNSIIINILV